MGSTMFQPFPGKQKFLVRAISAILVTSPATIIAQDNGEGENETVEEMLVTGIRGSLRNAIALKKNSDVIVDGINSEDIGKFPDKNVADSLQRVAGVSVDRTWGEGRDIFVRGTNSDVNRTLMNGQNVASAFWWANDNPSRGFNYTILASELVSSLEVHKSPAADIDEGSIGGTVIVRTRRPMDMDPMEVYASVESVYSDLSEEADPQYSGLVSWRNESETFGVLASYNSQSRSMRRDTLESFPTNTLYDVVDENAVVTEDVYAVWGGGSSIFLQDRERETVNLTAQWQPDDQWDVVLNVVSSDLQMDNSNQNYVFLLGGAMSDSEVNSVVDPIFIPTSDGRQALVGGTFTDPNVRRAGQGPIDRDSFVEVAVYDLDVNYQGEGWEAHFQAGVTEAEGGSDRDLLYFFTGNSGTTINLTNSIEASYADLDPLDGSTLNLAGPGFTRDFIRKMEDEESYLQADLEMDVDWGFINSIKVGAKLRDHTITNNRTTGSIDTLHPNWLAAQAITLDQASTSSSPSLSGESAGPNSVTRYAFGDLDLLRSVIAPVLNTGVLSYSFDQNAFYEINEDITAFYVKATFEQDNLRGNFGIRAVKTDQSSKSFIDGVLGSVSRDYTEYLPSLNVIYSFSEDVLLRASVSQVMARPTFQNLSANIVIDATTDTASGGNPQLDAFKADQFDLGAEWYFGEGGLLSATYFQKDISTFIFSETAIETIDGQQLSVTRPRNSTGADIKGVELQWQQFLGYGFGLIANYTFTDASVPAQRSGQSFNLPGNSEDQFNASVYFENEKLSARLSYNYRSQSFGDLISGSQLATDDFDQLDATFSWHVSDNIELFATGVNLTNEVVKVSTSDGIPVSFFENGSRYSLGFRFKY